MIDYFFLFFFNLSVKQTLKVIIGTTLSGELINDLEAKNMVVMGIFSTGIDLIPLGSILKSCNTVKSLAVAATKDIVTSEAIGYTNSFMASCGAPPSTLIIVNLLATSVFTHYNKVSPIKDLDGMPPKVNSANIEYIDDEFSGNTKSMIGDKNDVVTIEKVVSNEIDIKPNHEHMVEYSNDGFQSNNVVKVVKSADDVIYNAKSVDKAFGKHGKDFGSYHDGGSSSVKLFQQDVKKLINTGVQKSGTWYGKQGTHIYNPNTKQWVFINMDGTFNTAFKLSNEQYKYLIETGVVR